MSQFTKLFIFLLVTSISFSQDLECYDDKPDESGCSDQFVCKSCTNKNCRYCNYDALDQCTGCFTDHYLYNNNCFPTRPDGTFCDENLKVCQTCKVQNCNRCSDDKQSCQLCEKDYYLLTHLDSSTQTCEKLPVVQKSVCKKNSSLNNQTECISCEYKCNGTDCDQNFNSCGPCKSKILNFNKKCSDLEQYSDYCSNGQCLKCNTCQKCEEDECSCNFGFVIKDGTCQSNSVVTYPSTFSEEDIKVVAKQTEASSQAVAQSSVVLSQAQTLVSSSSFGLLITGLTNQKIVYLVLVQANLPIQVYTTLMASLDQIPSQQIQMLNFFTELFKSDTTKYNEFLNLKFQSVKLSYNIFYNCGQGISIFLICSFLFAFFYLLTEKITHEKVSSLSKTLYNKLFSGLIIQYFQLVLSMFAIGINAQLLEFAESNEIEHLEAKITITLLLCIIVFLIFYKLYYYLNFQTIKSTNLNFPDITREKIQNQTIFESKYKRNYMLIHLAIESILIPTIFIQLHFSYIATSVLSIILQISLLAITIYLMPFYSKLTNYFFVLTSIFWVILYIEYLILMIYSSKENISDYAATLDKCSWAFIVTLQIILFSSPLYMILSLIVQIVDLIKAKIREKNNKSESNLDLLQNSSKKLPFITNNFQQESFYQSTSIYSRQFQNKFRSSYIGTRKFQKRI